MTIFDKLFARTPSRRTRKRGIQLDDGGFSVSLDGSDAARVDWLSVEEIVAFKRDWFGYDEICLGFRCECNDGFWWVGEEDVGFKELQAAVERRFDGLREDWWSVAAFPAFEENWSSIWLREKSE